MTSDAFDSRRIFVRVFIFCCLFIIFLGCLFRIWQITQNQFFFYDEGMYLNHNRLLGQIIKNNYPLNNKDFSFAFLMYLRSCFSTAGKLLWQMVLDVRLFWGLLDQWFWARVISAVCGIMTICLTYFFTLRHFRCRWTAWLAAVFLAILPSHVFYSRLALQEAFSTLLVLLGFYFYVFPRRFSWRTFLAGAFFSAAFFSNYRLISLPLIIGVAEGWMSITEKRFFDLRKYVWCVVTFLTGMFGIGGTAFGGTYIYITFAWIFHQQHIAHPAFHWINFLTYPYDLFRLENALFALFFFSAPWIFWKRERPLLLPFMISLGQMAIFSMAMEKGARYICVILPFVAMTVASVVVDGWRHFFSFKKYMIAGLCLVMVGFLLFKSYRIAEITSDYQPAVEFLLQKDPGAKFLSSQKTVQDLYVRNPGQVVEMPASFPELAQLFSEGYQYLVIDPQAYVSFTEDQKRFSSKLHGHYEYILRNIEPIKRYDHFSGLMLERHVMEHSTNLWYSIEFLRMASSRGYGSLYVFDLNMCLPQMMQALFYYQQQRSEGLRGDVISSGSPDRAPL